jgi:hydrogenase maturation protease
MILIIGYGNPLCSDDGVGPYAVEQLALEDTLANNGLPGDVEYLSVHQLIPELAEPISRADAIIFVDAAYGETPGEITCDELKPLAKPFEMAPAVFTHHIKAAVLLESARFLYNRQSLAWLYTLTAENFELGDSFSPTVKLALPSLLDQLKARITQCMNSALQKQ